jgi:hypothetical protein
MAYYLVASSREIGQILTETRIAASLVRDILAGQEPLALKEVYHGNQRGGCPHHLDRGGIGM